MSFIFNSTVFRTHVRRGVCALTRCLKPQELDCVYTDVNGPEGSTQPLSGVKTPGAVDATNASWPEGPTQECKVSFPTVSTLRAFRFILQLLPGPVRTRQWLCQPVGLGRRDDRYQLASSVTFDKTSFLTIALAVCFLPGCALFELGAWSEFNEGELSRGQQASDSSGTGGNKSADPTFRSESKLTRRGRNTIPLHVEFLHLNSSQLGESFWQSIDETTFSSQTRQAWLHNGLRIGLLTASQNLAGSAEREARSDDPITQLLTGAGVLGESSRGRETIPLRPSQRHELPLSPVLEGGQVVLVKSNQEVIGRHLHSPQMLLSMTASPGPREGRVTMSLRPEIHYGSMRQKFVSSEAAVRIHAGRDRWELTEMNLDWQAIPGATLVIAPAHDAGSAEPTFALGRQMLRDREHLHDDQHVVVLLSVEPPQGH